MVSLRRIKNRRSNVRLETRDVRNAVHLMPGLVAGIVDVANLVQELHAHDPLVDCELDLSGEVVEMPQQRGKHLASTRSGIGADRVDDVLCEIGVEAVLWLLAFSIDGCHF